MHRRFAIILGGGRSARMGRDKRALTLGGRSLLAIAVDACATHDGIVVVSPDLPDDVPADRVTRTLEDPPFGGPVAGIAAGLSALPPAAPGDQVLLLACDLPRVNDIVRVVDAAPPSEGVEAGSAPIVSTNSTDEAGSTGGSLDRLDQQRALDQHLEIDGICLLDAEGYPQYLAARYRRASLDARLAEVGETRGLSVRRLMAALDVRGLAAADLTDDVDTPDEAAAAGLE